MITREILEQAHDKYKAVLQQHLKEGHISVQGEGGKGKCTICHMTASWWCPETQRYWCDKTQRFFWVDESHLKYFQYKTTEEESMNNKEKLAMCIEAIAAHGDTDRIEEWYKKYKPEYYKDYGLPVAAQYSLSCFLMDHTMGLLLKDCEYYHGTKQQLEEIERLVDELTTQN